MDRLIFLAVVLIILPFSAHAQTFIDIGVAPGGDITDALDKVWKEAIASPTPVKITIGPGEYTLKQAHLMGPSKAPLELEVKGTVKAPADPNSLPNKEWEWITINYISFFTLSGGGVLDGQGQQAWKQNDCNKNSNCAKLPIFYDSQKTISQGEFVEDSNWRPKVSTEPENPTGRTSSSHEEQTFLNVPLDGHNEDEEVPPVEEGQHPGGDVALPPLPPHPPVQTPRGSIGLRLGPRGHSPANPAQNNLTGQQHRRTPEAHIEDLTAER
ncbi:hypothetical protein OROMI_008205 [Orobanche minor]